MGSNEYDWIDSGYQNSYIVNFDFDLDALILVGLLITLFPQFPLFFGLFIDKIPSPFPVLLQIQFATLGVRSEGKCRHARMS